MGAVAGAEPAAVVAGLADGHTTQVGADAEHDEPLGALDAVLVGLGVAQGGDVDLVGLLDLVLGSVADEDGLAAPLDDDLYGNIWLVVGFWSFWGGEDVVRGVCVLTFLPSGMVFRSTSTLAMAKTSAEADMLTRNSAANPTLASMPFEKEHRQLLRHSSSNASIALPASSPSSFRRRPPIPLLYRIVTPPSDIPLSVKTHLGQCSSLRQP